MQLYVWGPALDAPSIDPKCTVVEAYLRLVSQDYSVVHCNDPHTSPTGELPLLKDGAVWVAGVDRILKHLRRKGLDADASLSDKDRARSTAYSALCQDTLHDVMLFAWYTDTTNFIKCIRPAYASLLSFPTCYLAPLQLKKNAGARLAKYAVEIVGDDVTLPENEAEEMKELQRTGWHHMYRLARDTYAALESALEQDYFFGTPTTLDCLVFGYLSLHLYPQLPHNRLSIILRVEFPQLARFCDRFKATHFHTPSTVHNTSSTVAWRSLFSMNASPPTPAKKKSETQLDFERKRVWSIGGGVTFVLAYIIYHGLLQIEFEE
ncbi:hypothetical protein BDF14DRAFT_1759248 [Spinellus fusiger]|nr:hypothetical protein BDF14DRAFT_1759248 [Spinellus fusiger]